MKDEVDNPLTTHILGRQYSQTMQHHDLFLVREVAGRNTLRRRSDTLSGRKKKGAVLFLTESGEFPTVDWRKSLLLLCILPTSVVMPRGTNIATATDEVTHPNQRVIMEGMNPNPIK